jgi:hypothetical protein
VPSHTNNVATSFGIISATLKHILQQLHLLPAKISIVEKMPVYVEGNLDAGMSKLRGEVFYVLS